MTHQDRYHTLLSLVQTHVLLSYHTLLAHWHCRGRNFFSDHAMFEDHYKQLIEITDELAERIRYDHAGLPSTLKSLISQCHEDEFPIDRPDEQINHLIRLHKKITQELILAMNNQSLQGSPGLIDTLTKHLGSHEKIVWFYESSYPNK